MRTRTRAASTATGKNQGRAVPGVDYNNDGYVSCTIGGATT